ncbi:MAG: tetratricopeptide repeat protein [Bacteroidales bacterium]|nr:MAG: tetratricopeptide repeat protein [Bacteroidales bacterium]
MHSKLFFKCLFFLLIPNGLLQAQDNRLVDSLLNTIPTSYKDSIRIREIIRLANNYYLNNSDLTKELTKRILDESITANYKLGMADAYNLFGIIYLNNSKYDSALIELSKAKILYFELNNQLGIVNCYNNVALVYSDLGMYSDAIINYIQALKAIESFNNESLAAIININLGKLYIELNVYDEAEKCINKGLELTKKYNLKGQLEYIYNMLGDIACEKKNFSKAIEYYNLCFDECKRTNNILLLAGCYLSMGNISELKDDVIQAEKSYTRGLEIADEINVPSQKVRALNYLSYLYLKVHDNVKAKDYATKAYKISDEIDFKEGLKNASLNLSYINYSIGDYQRAYDNLMYSDTILSDISDNKIVFAISDLLTKIKNDQIEYSTQISLQRKKIRNLVLLVIVFFLITLIIGIVLIYRRKIRKSRMKENLLNRELTSKVMFLAKRNEVFSKVETMLSQNKNRFIPENQPLIQEVIDEIQSAQDQHVWKDFEYYFTSVHKDFYSKLYAQFPTLTVNERRLCALLRLNLTTKDISSITHQSMHSIDIARARLRKKLGLSNMKVSIYSFLATF